MSSAVVSNDTYHPSYFVNEMHSVLHLNNQLKLVSNDFGLETQSLSYNSYVKSCLVVPAICLIIASLCMLIFLLWSSCCSSIFNSKNNSNNNTNRLIIISCLIFCIIVAVFADQLMLFGYHPYINDGVNEMIDNLNYLYDTFVILNDDGEQLITYADNIKEDLVNAVTKTPTCSRASLLINSVEQYIDYLNDYNIQIDNLPNKFSLAKDYVNTYLVDYRDYFLYGLYALILFVSIWYSIGCYLTNQMFVRIGINCSQFFLILLFLLSTVIFFILIVLADFCENPSNNFIGLLSTSSSSYDVVKYYVTCNGVNPIQDDLNNAHKYLNELKVGINTLLSTFCPSNQYLLDASNLCDESNAILINSEYYSECSTIQSYYQNIINEGACNEIYEGLYFVWLSYYVSAAGILFASFFLWSLFSKDNNSVSNYNEDDILLASDDNTDIQEVSHANYDSFHTPLAEVTISEKFSAPIEPLDEYMED